MRAPRWSTLVFLLATGCRSAPVSTSPSGSANTAALPPALAPTATAPNRDTHSEPDVAKYIAGLSSESRVADLQVPVVVEKLDLPRDAIVGDLGCGPGVFTVAFAKACPDGVVLACDIEPRQLDAVREKIHAEKLANVIPVLASPDDPHFPPGRMDVVFIGDTYHHLEDRVAYMKRLKATLKPGGRLVLLEYKPGKLPVGPPPEHKKLKAGEMDKELGDAGFVQVEKFDTHPYHDFEVWRVRQRWEKDD
jgi:SAM-dependent methyltransferase